MHSSSRAGSLPRSLHVHSRTRHRCPLIVEQPRCPSAVARSGCSVGIDDTPPGHAVAEQAHRPSYLPWARTDPLADITVGSDETSWDGDDYFTDIFDNAHAAFVQIKQLIQAFRECITVSCKPRPVLSLLISYRGSLSVP